MACALGGCLLRVSALRPGNSGKEQCQTNCNWQCYSTGCTQAQKTVQKPKVATLVEKLGSGITVDLYTIGGNVSFLHTNSMVIHYSQK